MATIDDLCYERQGKIKRILFQEQKDIINPIEIRDSHHQKALLLLHGFSSSPAVFREILPILPPYNAIICPVLPGHADSISAFSATTARDWITCAERALEALLKDYESVDVMGLSLGGLLACHLSQHHPFNHLYLLAPALALKSNSWFTRTLAYVLQYLGFKQIHNRAGNIHAETQSELTYRRLPISSIIEILSLVHRFKFTAPLCQTDVFLGCFDEVVDSDKVAKYFSGVAQSQIHWLKNSAHILPLDGDLDTIVNCMKNNWKQDQQAS